MKVFVVIAAILVVGSQATVIKCKGGTSGGAAVTAAATDCASGVSVCMMTTTYNEAAFTNVASSEWKCATASDTLKTCQSDTTNNKNVCYCTGNSSTGCNDIEKCQCATGTGMTKYANKAENTKAATNNNSGAESMAKVAGTTMAAAAVAWWLL